MASDDKYHYDKYLQERVSFNEPQIEQFRKLLEKMFNEDTIINEGYKEITLGEYFRTRVLELGDRKVPLFDIFNEFINNNILIPKFFNNRLRFP